MRVLRSIAAFFREGGGSLRNFFDMQASHYRGVTSADVERMIRANNEAQERQIGDAMKRWRELN